MLLGRPLVDGLVYFGVGDSILCGTNDDSSQAAYGRGFFQIAMQSGSQTLPIPSANFGIGGAGTGAFNGNKWKAWAAYANRGVDEIVSANVSSQSVATMQSSIQGIWAAMKTAGIQKIIRTQLMAWTNSTDSWATAGNQTPIDSNWNTGGRVDQMNAWFATQVGTNIEAFCSMSSVLDTNQSLWKTNGTANRMTNDGVHLYDNGANGVGNVTSATALRSARTTLN